MRIASKNGWRLSSSGSSGAMAAERRLLTAPHDRTAFLLRTTHILPSNALQCAFGALPRIRRLRPPFAYLRALPEIWLHCAPTCRTIPFSPAQPPHARFPRPLLRALLRRRKVIPAIQIAPFRPRDPILRRMLLTPNHRRRALPVGIQRAPCCYRVSRDVQAQPPWARGTTPARCRLIADVTLLHSGEFPPRSADRGLTHYSILAASRAEHELLSARREPHLRVRHDG